MISFTVLECLFRSEFRILFLGFLQAFELEYMFLEFVVDSLLMFTGFLYFMILFRFGDDFWKLFAEPVRFMFVLNIT